MRIGGFTIIRNAIKHDFPVLESISSILPICSEFVVAVGKSDDDTLGLIQSLNSTKIKIIETVWDESLSGSGGRVLAVETNKALNAVSKEVDWAFYLQSDEIVHEKDLPLILSKIKEGSDDPRVDGLLFKYLHFYGSYDYYASSPHWYSHEIRAFKTDRLVYSYNDAQGFRKGKNQKLWVKIVDAHICHYGWVKEPSVMQKKRIFQMGYYHKSIDKEVLQTPEFDYRGIDQLSRFDGTHPTVMKKRIEKKNWNFDYDLSFNTTRFKDRVKNIAAKYFGVELGYKNYRLIK